MPPAAGTELATPRLRLRQFAASDIDAYAAMCADPEVMRYLSLSGDPLSREDAWRQMSMLAGHWILRGFGTWVVEEKETCELVGRVGLHFPEGWPERELGWTIARKFWGRGYAFEAASAAAQYAFETLGWDQFVSLIHPDNSRSIRLAERLGSRFDGFTEVRGVRSRVYRLRRPRT